MFAETFKLPDISQQVQVWKFCTSTLGLCCLSHCEKNPHSGGDDVQVDLFSFELPDAKDVEFDGLVDKSWILELADYEADLLESVPFALDNFMSVLCSVNRDLESAVEVDETASADKHYGVRPCVMPRLFPRWAVSQQLT